MLVTKPSNVIETQTEFEVTISSVKRNKNGMIAIARLKNEKIVIQSTQIYDIQSGMKVKVYGKMTKPKSARIPNAFDYKEYLRYQNIHHILLAEDLIVVEQNIHFNHLNEVIKGYFETFPTFTKSYLFAFILGDDTYFDSSTKMNVSRLGISHLFAISGLHISIIIALFHKISKFVNLKEQVTNKMVIVFLLVYTIGSSFLISILRAVTMEVIKYINQSFKLGLSNLDILALTFILLVSVNPFYMMHLGFQLSFVVSLGLILGTKISTQYDSWWIQSFLICLISMLMSFVLVVNLNYEINIWSLIINVFFVYLVSNVLLPFAFLVAIVPVLSYLFEPIAFFYEEFTSIIANLLYVPLTFAKPSYIIICLFLLITYLIFKQMETKRFKVIQAILYVLFIVTWSSLSHISLEDEIYFLAVSHGESTVIRESFGKCTMVIDTGEGRMKEVTQFLRSKGIHTIDYLVITHGDLDHMGEAITIMQTFFVKNILINEFDHSSGIQTIITSNRNSAIIRAKRHDQFHCGRSQFKILGPTKNWENTNKNSLIILCDVFGKKILMTGDIDTSVEHNLILEYPNLSFDILKAAHHGSNTSTSYELVNHTQFSEVVIMPGVNNRFGFPHQQVIDRLSHVKLYRMDLDGTICYRKKWFSKSLTTT